MFAGVNQPVILPGEASEKGFKSKNGAGQKPAVLTEERPPIAPPEYSGRSPQTKLRSANQYEGDTNEQHPLLHMPMDSRQGQPTLELRSDPSLRK